MFEPDYMTAVVDAIVGVVDLNDDPALNELYEGTLTEMMVNEMIWSLKEDDYRCVNSNTWLSFFNLRDEVDYVIDNSDNYIKRIVFNNHYYNESERKEIVDRCALAICRRLQQRIGRSYKVCYKVMQNGRVGFRLE